MATEEGPDGGHAPAAPGRRPHDHAEDASGSDHDELPARRPHSLLWGSLNRTADAVLSGGRSAARLIARIDAAGRHVHLGVAGA
jgi:hypothetical protein